MHKHSLVKVQTGEQVVAVVSSNNQDLEPLYSQLQKVKCLFLRLFSTLSMLFIVSADASEERALSFLLALPFTSPVTTEQIIAWHPLDYQ